MGAALRWIKPLDEGAYILAPEMDRLTRAARRTP
jgi:hypothetical protein